MRYEEVTREALKLPEVEESTSYGTPSLKVSKKMMVRLKEDGETAVVRTTWEDRERLIATYPEQFFFTEHYRNSGLVLLRLPFADLRIVRDLLKQAWLLCASKKLLRKYGDPSESADKI